MVEVEINSVQLIETVTAHCALSVPAMERRISIALGSGMFSVRAALVDYRIKGIPGSPLDKDDRLGGAPGCLTPELLRDADEVTVHLGSDTIIISGKLDPFGIGKSPMAAEAVGLAFLAKPILGLFGLDASPLIGTELVEASSVILERTDGPVATPKLRWQAQRPTPQQISAMEFFQVARAHMRAGSHPKSKSQLSDIYRKWIADNRKGQEPFGRSRFEELLDRYEDGWRISKAKWHNIHD